MHFASEILFKLGRWPARGIQIPVTFAIHDGEFRNPVGTKYSPPQCVQ